MSEASNLVVERVARIICANELSGFCSTLGYDVQGCMVGRGVSGGQHCKASLAQLALSGSLTTARSCVDEVCASALNNAGAQ